MVFQNRNIIRGQFPKCLRQVDPLHVHELRLHVQLGNLQQFLQQAIHILGPPQHDFRKHLSLVFIVIESGMKCFRIPLNHGQRRTQIMG